jgi:hypothetical protein
MKWVDVTTGVAEFLDSVIGHAAQVTVPWRRILAEKPAMISFCKKRLIQYFGDENVYLLRGERISGAHAELFTYDLYIGLLLGKHDKGDLVPFSKPQYNEHQADDPAGPPCVFLEFECVDGIIVLGVCNQNGKFELQLFNRKGALPANMKEALKSSAAFVERDNEKITQTVDWSKIEDTIDGVVAVIRRLAKQSHLSTSTPNLRMTD